jgi:hypothetical protein
MLEQESEVSALCTRHSECPAISRAVPAAAHFSFYELHAAVECDAAARPRIAHEYCTRLGWVRRVENADRRHDGKRLDLHAGII